MLKKPAPPRRANLRGSEEAIAKRVSARHFNDLLAGDERPRDGRSEKKRKRLSEELRSGKSRTSKKALKPVDILQHAAELLELGETLTSLRKIAKYDRLFVAVEPEKLVPALAGLHAAYQFPLDVYRFAGIDDRTLDRAGVIEKKAEKAKRPKGMLP